MFAYTLTPNSINLFIGGKPRTLDKTHANYEAIRDALKLRHTIPAQYQAKWEEALLELIDIRAFVAKVTEGRVQVSDDTVLFSGKPVHSVIRDRLLTLLAEGFDIHPLAKFLDKLMDNPTESSRDDLYLWLEHSKMPITADGDFLAYKYVNQDFTSCHDRKTRNDIGSVVEMPREECDTNRHSTCSTGLHFCAFDYLTQMGGSGNRTVILKINPRDVTAIPADYHNAKGRACRYEVIGEVEGETKFPAVVNGFGSYEETVDPPYDLPEAPADEHPCDHSGCGCDGEDEVETEAEAPTDLKPTATIDIDGVPSFKPPRYAAYTPHTLIEAVKAQGQRGFARDNEVPRTTLQGWLRKAEAWIKKDKRRWKKFAKRLASE
jgi:hypothetical protein